MLTALSANCILYELRNLIREYSYGVVEFSRKPQGCGDSNCRIRIQSQLDTLRPSIRDLRLHMPLLRELRGLPSGAPIGLRLCHDSGHRPCDLWFLGGRQALQHRSTALSRKPPPPENLSSLSRRQPARSRRYTQSSSCPTDREFGSQTWVWVNLISLFSSEKSFKTAPYTRNSPWGV
jgi:hypothetical protein